MSVAGWLSAIETAERHIRDLERQLDSARSDRIPDRDRISRLQREIDGERRRIVELQSFIRRAGGR